ncbi:uncharacterized protein LOC127877494 [Dreissena polymorpha]|uniref:uncharacterized protein LOC127877494 n=1 Tax=Dreissena polymorpha TaxID=45954 RepID=UPI0022641B3A|nr:uncharacterized protein LOC127877494 [Dreissena polymorpha]
MLTYKFACFQDLSNKSTCADKMADTDEDVISSTEQNCNIIENELIVLYQRCQNNRKSSRQIRNAAKLFLEEVDPNEKRLKQHSVLFPWFFIVTCSAVVIGVLLLNDDVYRLATSSWRKSLIKVLPVFDWASLHSVQCLIHNPLSKNGMRELQLKNCEVCTNIRKVSVLEDHTAGELIDQFIDRDEPVLVHRVASLQPSISVQELTELFVDNDLMSIYTGCEFESNLPSHEVRNQRALLMGIRDGRIYSYYARWRNCFAEAAKLFRQVYRRPEYIPASVELSPSNWVFICSEFTDRRTLEMPVQDEFMVLAQLLGSMELALTPREPCKGNCTQIKATLNQGDTLLLTDFFYDLEYITCTSDTSITVGLVGKIDL